MIDVKIYLNFCRCVQWDNFISKCSHLTNQIGKNTQFGFLKELIFAITLTIADSKSKKEIYLEKVVSVSQATSHTHQW